jgi:ankyrin repeat protein
MSSQLIPELLAATTEGDLDLVKSLFPVSSPPASIDEIATEATKAGKVNILSWCYSEGFIPPHKSMNGDFYHAACDSSSPDIWKELVKHGYDLNAHWSEFYGDALCLAAWKGNVELAKTLLELGQDPNSDHYFSDETAMEIVELLVKYGLKLEGTGAASKSIQLSM